MVATGLQTEAPTTYPSPWIADVHRTRPAAWSSNPQTPAENESRHGACWPWRFSVGGQLFQVRQEGWQRRQGTIEWTEVLEKTEVWA
jgi:hypothetical protein